MVRARWAWLMPTRRLPWFKLWIGSTSHGKVRQLDDGAFRTWVELLDAAAQQPTRGRFASAREAASVTRRPLKHVQHLLQVGLIDDRDGLWMHDWNDWQRWRPEDTINTRSPTDHPPNDQRNGTASTHDQHTMDTIEKEKEKEKETKDVTPPAPAVLVPPRGRRRVTVADAEFIETLVSEFAERLGGPSSVRESIADALSHQACLKRTDQHAYLRNWLRKDARASPHTSPLRLSEVSARDRDGLPLGRKLPA